MGCVVLEFRRINIFVWCQKSAVAHPDFVSCWIAQEFDQFLCAIAWVCDREQCTRTQYWLAEVLFSKGWKLEEISIFTNNRTFWEERRDERCLTVHVALWWAAEHAFWAVAEVG